MTNYDAGVLALGAYGDEKNDNNGVIALGIFDEKRIPSSSLFRGARDSPPIYPLFLSSKISTMACDGVGCCAPSPVVKSCCSNGVLPTSSNHCCSRTSSLTTAGQSACCTPTKIAAEAPLCCNVTIRLSSQIICDKPPNAKTCCSGGVGGVDGADGVAHFREVAQDGLDLAGFGLGGFERGTHRGFKFERSFGKVGFGHELGAQQPDHEHADHKNAQRQKNGGFFVQQRPAQDALVAIGQALGAPVKPAGHAANAFVVPADRCLVFAVRVDRRVVPDAREHGVEREAHKHRDHHGRHDGDAELVEELADDAFHEADGQKHRHDRQGGGQHGQANLLRALQRGLVRVLAHLHMAHDVLAHHNRVVDQQAHTQAQRHQRDHVDGEAEHLHEHESAYQGDRQRQARDDGGAPGVEEQKHDQHREDGPFDQGLAHVVHRHADGPRAVGDGFKPQTRRQLGLQFGHGLDQAIDHLDGVFVLRLLHRHQERALAVVERQVFQLLRAVLHCGHLRQANGAAIFARHDDAAKVLGPLHARADLHHAFSLQ